MKEELDGERLKVGGLGVGGRGVGVSMLSE